MVDKYHEPPSNESRMGFWFISLTGVHVGVTRIGVPNWGPYFEGIYFRVPPFVFGFRVFWGVDVGCDWLPVVSAPGDHGIQALLPKVYTHRQP